MIMTWFEKIFKGADTAVKDLADHVEAEFKSLEARVKAVEEHLFGTKERSETPPPPPPPPIVLAPGGVQSEAEIASATSAANPPAES
jgi:hypothetical protein